MIAPCVNVLRQLGRNFKQMLGSDLGTAHHPMDLSVDLPDLMESLDDHEVYTFKKGRHLDNDDLPVPDIISVGLNELHSGKLSPLKDYNMAFQRLQARRRLVPLVDVVLDDSTMSDPNPDPNVDPAPMVPPIMSSPHPPYCPMPLVQPPSTQPTTNRTDKVDDHDFDGLEEFEDDDDVEELGEFLESFDDDAEPSLSLETAADVSLDMDAEDVRDDSDVEFDDDGGASGQDSDGEEGQGSSGSDTEFSAF